MTELTTVRFHGHDLKAVGGKDKATTIVAMKSLVEAMTMDWPSQYRKIVGHPTLSKGVVILTIPSEGGDQNMLGLPLKLLPLWLATIQPNKVPLPLRDKVIAFQEECADALAAHFFGHENPNLHDLRTKVDELTEMVKAVMAGNDPRRITVYDFRSMNTVLDDLEVPSKGRKGLSNKMGSHCVKWLMRHGREAGWKHDERNIRIFQNDVIRLWMKEEGAELVRAHNAKVAGQGTLPLMVVKGGKP